MADEMMVTVIGNLVADPELRFTPSGAAVANYTIAKTPRVFDKQSQEWRDEETLFVRGSVWREQAENFAETCRKGMRVLAYGKLKSRSYQDKEGQTKNNWELDAEDIGPSMRNLRGKVEKVGRGGGDHYGGQIGGGGGQQRSGGGQQRRGPAPYADSANPDVWNAGSGGQLAGDWGTAPADNGGGAYNEPPF